ncbi:Trans-aconitate 2-methyltransferase [uncultured archaeon]|nr:Trans-aconitate 2-methyltransferase [uncultured archaeon]
MVSQDGYSKYQERLSSPFDPFKFEIKVLNGYWTMTETGRRVKSTFEESLPQIPSGRILDLGCSIGMTTEEIASLYPSCNVYGIDMNPRALEIARERVNVPEIEFILGDGFRKPFPAEHFDGIFCMNNLGFTFNPGNPQTFKRHLDNILSMVRQEGYLLFAGGLCTVAVMQKTGNGQKIKSLLVGEHENEQYMAQFLLDSYQK